MTFQLCELLLQYVASNLHAYIYIVLKQGQVHHVHISASVSGYVSLRLVKVRKCRTNYQYRSRQRHRQSATHNANNNIHDDYNDAGTCIGCLSFHSCFTFLKAIRKRIRHPRHVTDQCSNHQGDAMFWIRFYRVHSVNGRIQGGKIKEIVEQ